MLARFALYAGMAAAAIAVMAADFRPAHAQTPPTAPAAQPESKPGAPAQAAPAAPAEPFGEEVTLAARPIVFVKGSGNWDNAFETIAGAFKKLKAYVDKEAVKTDGNPMMIFTSTDNDGFDYQAAVPVAEAVKKPARDDIFVGQLPDGRALKFVHRGSYDDLLNNAYEAIMNRVEEKRLETKDVSIEEFVTDPAERAMLKDRAVVVARLKALPVEAVVRGYVIGSGWKDYQRTGGICGVRLPQGLKQADRLPEPIFTPATKAAVGEHDENVPFERIAETVGRELAEQVRRSALAIYAFAAEHARARGIIIADTKFEFGVDGRGRLVLIDEVLTPDSSRFWPAASYVPGQSPPSFDKQYVRDYLETLDWNKRAPGPRLPEEIIRRTSEKYLEALRRLTAP